MKHLQSFVFFLAFAAAGALTPAAADNRGDMSVFVAVGDSLVAGSQNVGLEAGSQENGFAALIARQARVNFPLPLVQFPGAPMIIGFRPDGSIGPLSPPVVVGRINPTVVPANLGVPSFSVKHALEYQPDASIPRTLGDRGPLVLGMPGVYTDPALADCPANPRPACKGKTMIEQARERKPTTTLVWIGNNDILIPALTGQLSGVTKISDFETAFARLMSELQKTGSSLVVGNIPDVTLVPYFESAKAIAEQYGLSSGTLKSRLDLEPGDYVRRSALPIIDSIIKTGTPAQLPEMCPPVVYVFPSIPCRLRAADAEKLQETTKTFNRIIAKETHTRGGVLVDTNKLVERMAKKGYKVDRQRLTTEFLGGLFSLDAVHPSNTGYAVIANEFIERMNSRLGLRIPEVNVDAVWALDPLKKYVPFIPRNSGDDDDDDDREDD